MKAQKIEVVRLEANDLERRVAPLVVSKPPSVSDIVSINIQ